MNRELTALRAAYRLGLDNEVILAIPASGFAREQRAQGLRGAGQVETICKRLSTDVAEAVRFAFLTGWRRTEVLQLRWAQVDWTGGFVRLENQEGCAFPITPALRAVLERRQEWTRQRERAQARIISLVFHRSGEPIRSFRRSWADACDKAGRPGLLFHDLRRSAVRNLERAGVARSVAMKLTGHKTESVYWRYAIVAESDPREAGLKLATSAELPAAQAAVGASDAKPQPPAARRTLTRQTRPAPAPESPRD